MIGQSAGVGSRESSNSIFMGYQVATVANDSPASIMIGDTAGYGASNHPKAIFIGAGAGTGVADAISSIAIGTNALTNAYRTERTVAFGYYAGKVTNAGQAYGNNNIIIGTAITLPPYYANYANIGGVLFISGTYDSSVATMLSGSKSNAKVGIGILNPQYTLDVSGSGRFSNGLTVTGSLNVSGSITGSLFGTASWATNVVNSGNSIFPYNGNAVITGSLLVSGSQTVTGSLNVKGITRLSGSLIVSASVSINNLSAQNTSHNLQYNTSSGDITYTNNPILPAVATVGQINTPDASDVYVRPQELETSKHATINIFNYLNFS